MAKKLVLDVNESQSSEGKSSAVSNDGYSQVPSHFVNNFYSSYDPYEESQDPNFDPFDDLDLMLPTDGNRECKTSHNLELEDKTNIVETEVEDETDSQDSDYLVDEDNNVDEVDVDMEDFEYNIDEEVEFMGSRDREQPPGSRLRKLRKQAHASEQIYKTYFYVGKEFLNKYEVKAYIKEHSVETMKEIRMKKNENERVRTVCRAVSVDPNNGIYPLAYRLVEIENTESWTWFLPQLGDEVDLYTNSNFTFVSDRKKGIIPAIAKLFPNAEHIYCVKHIHENMKKKWNGTAYKELLWRAAKATTVPDFQIAMEKLKEFRKPAYEWLNLIPPQHWSRSHFSMRSKSDVLLNNMSSMGSLCNGPLTPTATKILKANSDEARKYIVDYAGDEYYQIKPIRGRIHWPKCNVPTILLPPKHQPQVGRQPKERKKSIAEMDVMKIVKNGKLSREHKSVTCDKCKTKDQNSRSCIGLRVPKSNKRKVPSKGMDLDTDAPISS
ncbi:mutator type transposase [Tanacetum coccineum]